MFFFFFSSRRRHTRLQGDWSSDVCSSDLDLVGPALLGPVHRHRASARHARRLTGLFTESGQITCQNRPDRSLVSDSRWAIGWLRWERWARFRTSFLRWVSLHWFKQIIRNETTCSASNTQSSPRRWADPTGPESAAAVSNAGGLGILQAQFCAPPRFRAEIHRVRALTDKPFGVNLLLHFTSRPARHAVSGELRIARLRHPVPPAR